MSRQRPPLSTVINLDISWNCLGFPKNRAEGLYIDCGIWVKVERGDRMVNGEQVWE